MSILANSGFQRFFAMIYLWSFSGESMVPTILSIKEHKNEAAQVHRERLEAVVSQDYPYPSQQFSGRGIVICAGGIDYFTNAYVLRLRSRACMGAIYPSNSGT